MAGSHDLYSVSPSWLTAQSVHSVNFSGMPAMASATSPIDLFEQLRAASGHKLFSDPDEMLGDGLNLLSVLHRFMAECSCFDRVAVADAIMHAEGLIRAGHALSKTEGGAA